MTPWRIEPAAFRFVAQCLEQLRHRVPQFTSRYGAVNSECLSFRQYDFHATLHTWIEWVFRTTSPEDRHRVSNRSLSYQFHSISLQTHLTSRLFTSWLDIQLAICWQILARSANGPPQYQLICRYLINWRAPRQTGFQLACSHWQHTKARSDGLLTASCNTLRRAGFGTTVSTVPKFRCSTPQEYL